MGSYIAGLGAYLPERIVESDELEKSVGYERFGLKPGICRMLSGCKTRHYAADDECCSSMASIAAQEAMNNAGVTADEIDVVIFGAVSQDFAEPATANRVACNLGIHNAYAFDLKNACNAFIQGMDIADSLIRTGKAKTVLVCSGEVLSRWIKHEYDDIEELKTAAPVALTLGDAAGAFVIKETDDPNKGLIASYFHTEPDLWDNNVMWGGGVIYPRDPSKMFIPGTTQKIVTRGVELVPETLALMRERTGWELEDIDYFVTTQMANWLVNHAAKQTSIGASKAVNIVNRVGNCGACNLALAAYELYRTDRWVPGKRIVFTSGAVGFEIGVIAVVT